MADRNIFQIAQKRRAKLGAMATGIGTSRCQKIDGRLIKRGVQYTTPALLAGMWQFLTIIDVLERHTTAELEEMAKEFLKIIGSETEFKDV